MTGERVNPTDEERSAIYDSPMWGANFDRWDTWDTEDAVRWLREIRAQAWDEGYDECEAPHYLERRNPYREES